MKIGESFVYTTMFSYVAASILALIGFPALEGIDPILQSLIYGFAAIILNYARVHPEKRFLRKVLAAIYGVLASASFMGVQKWSSYANGYGFMGPLMALWDLALAVALLE